MCLEVKGKLRDASLIPPQGSQGLNSCSAMLLARTTKLNVFFFFFSFFNPQNSVHLLYAIEDAQCIYTPNTRLPYLVPEATLSYLRTKAKSGLQVKETGVKTVQAGSCREGDFLGLPFGPEYIQQLGTKQLKFVSKYSQFLIAFQRGRVQLLGQLGQLGCVT